MPQSLSLPCRSHGAHGTAQHLLPQPRASPWCCCVNSERTAHTFPPPDKPNCVTFFLCKSPDSIWLSHHSPAPHCTCSSLPSSLSATLSSHFFCCDFFSYKKPFESCPLILTCSACSCLVPLWHPQPPGSTGSPGAPGLLSNPLSPRSWGWSSWAGGIHFLPWLSSTAPHLGTGHSPALPGGQQLPREPQGAWQAGLCQAGSPPFPSERRNQASSKWAVPVPEQHSPNRAGKEKQFLRPSPGAAESTGFIPKGSRQAAGLLHLSNDLIISSGQLFVRPSIL